MSAFEDFMVDKTVKDEQRINQLLARVKELEGACAEMRYMLNAASLRTDIDWPDNYEFGKGWLSPDEHASQIHQRDTALVKCRLETLKECQRLFVEGSGPHYAVGRLIDKSTPQIQACEMKRRGFVDGLKEAYRLMGSEEEIIYAPGKILNKIKQLGGDDMVSLDPQPPPDEPT